MNANTSFEIRALAFYRMTGQLAPGKDAPAANPGESYEVRLALWRQWLEYHGPVIKALMEAVDEVLRLEDTP